jgi:sugar lactone lactonase YvrE
MIHTIPLRSGRLFAAVLLATTGYAWGAQQDMEEQRTAVQPPLPTLSAGYHVSVYAHVPEPMKLSFAPDGTLYVGRQPGARIHRIAPGGHRVSEFGPPQVDPDAVLFDPAGRIGGRRNSVLVGGDGGNGILAAIFPNQMSSVIFNTGFDDVDDMKFDHRGRLIFSDDVQRVLSSSGGPPRVLFSTPSRPGSIAIDERNRIFVALSDGSIRIYNPNGSLADSAFATGLAGLDTYLAFADEPDRDRDDDDGDRDRHDHGHATPLYVLSGTTLLRFDGNGHARTIGTGFVAGPSSGTGFVFGPDHALYVSDYYANRILRIARRPNH